MSHQSSFNGHISPYAVDQTGGVFSCHEVFADFNGNTLHSSQVVHGVSGIMGMTCRKEERIISLTVSRWSAQSVSRSVRMYLRMAKIGLIRLSNQSCDVLLSTEMASTSCSRSSMLLKLFFPKRGRNSSSTSILRALTFCGNFLPLSIFSTPPKATLSISTIPVSAISVPMQPQ